MIEKRIVRSTSQELPLLLQNLKVYYRFHMNLSVDPNLSKNTHSISSP
jgi:hypothetical protein